MMERRGEERKTKRSGGPVRLSINWQLTDSASDSAPLVVFKKSSAPEAEAEAESDDKAVALFQAVSSPPVCLHHSLHH